jgi:hypothetical protein
MLVRDAARRPASGDGSFAARAKGSEVCHVRPQLCNHHGGAGFRSFAVWSASNPQVEAHSTGRGDGLRNISTARLATPARLVALASRRTFGTARRSSSLLYFWMSRECQELTQ